MDFKYIEQLLERYWQCETSLEEEAQLRTFFTEEDVPEHLSRYKDLFVYQQLQQEEHLGADFDARVLAEIEAPVVKARRMTLTARFMPLFKAAAAVAVVLSLGNVMQHSFISAPSVALSGDRAATHEKQILDSLHRVSKEKENRQ